MNGQSVTQREHLNLILIFDFDPYELSSSTVYLLQMIKN